METSGWCENCKKALSAVEGDIEKAIDFLREKGLAGAQKKAGRIAAEGVVDENECLKSDCVKLQQYLMSKENLTELPDINIAGDFYDDSDSIVDCKYYWCSR